MPSIQVGQTGTLVFQPSMAGLTPEQVSSVEWQAQGGQTVVMFTPPDRVEGVAPGVRQFKVRAILTLAGEKVTYAFPVDCIAPGPPVMPPMVPVAIVPVVTPPPSPPPPLGNRANA